MSKIFLSCAFVLFFAGQTLADPVGETANYQLDKDSRRTSQSIKDGIVDLEVLRYKPQSDVKDNIDEKGVYEVELAYDLLISVIGRQEGEEKVDVSEKYFTPEFWIDLRKNGSYVSPEFKIKHEGYGDAKTIDGRTYKQCDKLYFYDIKTNHSDSPSIELIRKLFIWALEGSGIQVSPRSEVEDLEIRGFFKEGVPVLRGVKLDISGVVDGFPAKAGFDYVKKTIDGTVDGEKDALNDETYGFPADLKFIKMDSYQEENLTTPNIAARFTLKCNQKFHKILRVDVNDPNQNNKAYIFVAGLAEEDLTLNCEGTKTFTASAGQPFSGRVYEIQPVSDSFIAGLPFTVKFREAKNIFEQGGVLHPKLKVVIGLSEKEKIVHTTREDITYYPNGMKYIMVFAGSLVIEEPRAISRERDETVFYGYTYTQNYYEIKKITR